MDNNDTYINVSKYEDDDVRLNKIIIECGAKEYKGRDFLEGHRNIIKDLKQKIRKDD